LKSAVFLGFIVLVLDIWAIISIGKKWCDNWMASFMGDLIFTGYPLSVLSFGGLAGPKGA